MNLRKGLLFSLVAAVGAVSTSGCAMMHELKPHRLWKYNHGTSGMPPEDYFSSNHRGPSQPAGFFASVADDLPTQPDVPAQPTDRRDAAPVR